MWAATRAAAKELLPVDPLLITMLSFLLITMYMMCSPIIAIDVSIDLGLMGGLDGPFGGID